MSYLVVLEEKMDSYVHFIYSLTKNFPKEEIYGSNSQIRRASLSVVLNFVEGYARRRPAVKLNFWEISYGSLKESKYLLKFAYVEKWISEEELYEGQRLAEEIGAMLWKAIEAINL